MALTLLLGHRGDTALERENTLGAFAAARAAGADGVELDVRLSADGILVVHHDASIEGVGPVGELARQRMPSYVPTLAEALEACRGMVVNVELKNDPSEPAFDPTDALGALAGAELANAGWSDSAIVSSFRPECLEAARRGAPELALGLLIGWWDDVGAALERVLDRRYGGLHPFVTQVTPGLVDQAGETGTALRVWTVNAPADLVAMLALGVEAIVTDQIAAALEARRALGRGPGGASGSGDGPAPQLPSPGGLG